MRARAQSVRYYADDKDILDLLESQKQKLTATVLRAFLLRRGILVSDQEPREELVQYLATLFLDWPDLRRLLDHTDRNPRAERVTFATADTSAVHDDIIAALEAVKTERSEQGVEVLTVTRPVDGVYELRVSYSELDASKTRLAQRRDKEGALVISRRDGGYNLRHEANPLLQGIANDFLAHLSTGDEDEVPGARPISLHSLVATEARTDFFTGMMRGLVGMNLADVSHVTLQHALTSATYAGSVPQLEAEVSRDDAMAGDEELDEVLGNEAEATGLVRNMILRGETVLTSSVYADLASRFYVCGAVWESDELEADGVRVVFEARFEDQRECSDFRYQVRGIYPRSQRGEDHLLNTHRACNAHEQRHYLTLLEQAAEASLAAVLAVAEGTAAPDGG